MHFFAILLWLCSVRVLANTLYQGYSIILGKSLVTNAKIFRGPVAPIKSCKRVMFWIFLT